jgi:hypothetical protein
VPALPAKSRALGSPKRSAAQPSPWQLPPERTRSTPYAERSASYGEAISPATARWLAQKPERLR